MIKLSVIIITLNEEHNLQRCLLSVKDIADEIVVLDSNSTDKTIAIAKSFGAITQQHAFEGYVAARKRVEALASYDHILAIDADEALSNKLIESIKQLKNNWKYDGYSIARRTNYCGKWVNHSGWYPERKLRLYKRGSGEWTGKYVHEKFSLYPEKTQGKLNGDLLHYSYYRVEDHRIRSEKYAQLSALELFENNRKTNLLLIYIKTLFKFFRDFFLKFGFLDGKTGYTISYITARATYIKYMRLIELHAEKNAATYQQIKSEEHIQTKATEQPHFSILIPSWNNLDYLKLCLHSLRKNSAYNNQIIVAVNEGIDGTTEWLKKQNDIDFIHFEQNAGVCYAINGCRPHVIADYIVYLNDDMYVYPNWDKHLFEEIEKLGTTLFYLSATQIEPIKNNNPNYVAVYRNYGDSIENFEEEKLLAEANSFEIDNWRGSSWPPNVVHKKTWDLVGGYSVEFSPGMYSDPDFSMKLWHAGVRTFYGVGKSRVYHFGEKTTKRIKKNNGSNTFLQKWGVTAKTFYSSYLQLGKKYDGETYPQHIRLSYSVRLRNKLKKRFVAAFRKSS